MKRLFTSALLGLARVFIRALAPFLRRSLLRRPARRMAGFSVVVGTEVENADLPLDILQTALELVDRIAPRRARRMRADISRIVIEECVGWGLYSHAERAIILRPKLFEVSSLAWISSALVHEGTHARFWAAGIRTTEANRARTERRCCQEQIEFLNRLPMEFEEEAARCVAAIEQSLAVPDPWYSAPARRADLRERLTDIGAPPWLVRVLAPEAPRVKEAPVADA